MISILPFFRLGEHYRRNAGGKKWKFTTLRTTRVVIDKPIDETISFRDKNGIEWMRLAPTLVGHTLLTIREGYSWDGATKAPDCEPVMLASLVHDVLYQFRHTQHFPFSRAECDAAFYDLMHLRKFLLAGVYHAAVKAFGWKFGGDDGEWSKVLTTHPLTP